MDPWSEAAIGQNQRWLTAYLLAQTGNPTVADDLVQDVFSIAFEKRGAFEPGTNFGGWLRSIARNVVLRHFEKRARRPVIDQDEAVARLDRMAAAAEDRAVDPAWAGSRAEILRECLRKLTERARRLVNERYSLGRSPAAVSASTGQSVSAVNVALFRARAVLADCLRRKGVK